MAEQMSRGEEINTFSMAFLGQLVSITVDLMTSVVSSSEHGTVTENIPMVYQGILLDSDDSGHYLGSATNPNEVTQFVPKYRVVHMEVEDLLGKVFDEIPVPENPEEIN